jgi:hypothetical protein
MASVTYIRQNSNVISPGVLLRLEGVAAFIGAVTAYAHLNGSGWLFALLLFLPDVSMAGYLLNVPTGALTYNIAHTYIFPAALLALALTSGWSLGVLLALIWLAHIGMDRTLGFGLKYPTAFKDTHLHRV